MATFIAHSSVNINDLDLYWYNDNNTNLALLHNTKISTNSLTYDDVLEVEGDDGGDNLKLLLGGSQITVDNTDAVTGGTVNGMAEYDVGAGATLWEVEGVSIPAVDIYNSAFTISNSDELNLIKNALSGNDTFTMSNSADLMRGYDGNDLMLGRGGNDQLFGGNGKDILKGGFGNDILYGGWGNDKLIGAVGGDTLDGGNGKDTADYTGSGAGVTVKLWNGSASGGHATGDSFSSIENLSGSSFGDILQGDGGVNVLKGLGGNDKLHGGNGNDILYGGSGSDKLVGAVGGDTLDGGTGKDMADYSGSGAAVTVKLWNGSASGGHATGDSFSSIENLSGSSFGDILQGNGGANVLKGLGGNDKLSGLSGNDKLYGGNGKDTISGGNGRDTILGGAGNDILKGDNGQDTLTGGTGNDNFVFKDLNDSGPSASKRDTITDFSPGNDKIDVSAIDAITGGGDDSFTFIGSSAFTSTAGELRAFNSGAITLVQMDVDGDGVSDSTIELAGTLALTAGDFIL